MDFDAFAFNRVFAADSGADVVAYQCAFVACFEYRQRQAAVHPAWQIFDTGFVLFGSFRIVQRLVTAQAAGQAERFAVCDIRVDAVGGEIHQRAGIRSVVGSNRLAVAHFFTACAVVTDAGGDAEGIKQLGAVLQVKTQLARFYAGIRCIDGISLAVRGGGVVNVNCCAAAE